MNLEFLLEAMPPAPPHIPGSVPTAAMPEESARTVSLKAENGTTTTPALSKEEQEKIELLKPFTSRLVWPNVITFVVLHSLALWGIPRCLMFKTSIFTMLWAAVVGVLSAEGVLIGAHRLYSHKAFKANWKLRLLVVLWHTVAGQNCMYVWVRDHRLHHKFSDTNADPHNARRGFWFSHVGWLNMKKHPLVIEKGRQIDLSDLEADPIVMFQKKWYKPLYVFFALVLPCYIPCLLWNEYWLDSLLTVYFIRYCIVLNLTWTVNSAAHLWGTKPYDSNLMPRENIYVGFWGLGEGWHNFHHAFPWDYRAAELGLHYSPTTAIIDFFHRRGWAYSLKSASDDMVRKRMLRTGDGTHQSLSDEHHHHIEEAEPEPEDEPTEQVINTAEEPKLTARHRG